MGWKVPEVADTPAWTLNGCVQSWIRLQVCRSRSDIRFKGYTCHWELWHYTVHWLTWQIHIHFPSLPPFDSSFFLVPSCSWFASFLRWIPVKRHYRQNCANCVTVVPCFQSLTNLQDEWSWWRGRPTETVVSEFSMAQCPDVLWTNRRTIQDGVVRYALNIASYFVFYFMSKVSFAFTVPRSQLCVWSSRCCGDAALYCGKLCVL